MPIVERRGIWDLRASRQPGVWLQMSADITRRLTHFGALDPPRNGAESITGSHSGLARTVRKRSLASFRRSTGAGYSPAIPCRGELVS